MAKSIAEASYKALTGRTRRLENGSAAGKVEHLERQYGSMAEASRRTGIPRTTLRRWKDGKGVPKPDQNRKLTRALRESLVPEGRRKRVTRSTGKPEVGRSEKLTGKGNSRFGHGGLVVNAQVTISSDTRTRSLAIGQHLTAGTGEDLMNAFLDGNDERFTDLLNEAVSRYWGGGSATAPDWAINDVVSVSFTPIS